MTDQFKLVVFDWDGTLVNSIDWIVHSIDRAATVCGCPIPTPDMSKSIIGLGLSEALEKLFPRTGEHTKRRLIEEYRRCYLSKTFGEKDFFEGVIDMLGELRANGYLLAIATGKNRAGLDRGLQAANIGSLFSATICADETASKPHPAMLNTLMKKLNMLPADTLMVGDTEHDLKMAINANVASVGVACGANNFVQLARFKPLACLEQTAQLSSLLI